ncbi:phosphatidate cytidylyltransferase, partial [Pelagibacteraceae bacterium]|nr:phosphatidate cytidylyltransferase [Pelagibacteraceae bacterium]
FLSFNLFIILVISFDIFSYIFGFLFGKNKLTKISPNKTYEGLIGGVISSFLISLFFSFFADIILNTQLAIFLILIIFSAFIGDLIESYYKRKNNLKNSSELIPGHGGVFDRFDSFLFSIIFYSLSFKLLV